MSQVRRANIRKLMEIMGQYEHPLRIVFGCMCDSVHHPAGNCAPDGGRIEVESEGTDGAIEIQSEDTAHEGGDVEPLKP